MPGTLPRLRSVAFHRGIDGSEPIRPLGHLTGTEEERKAPRTSVAASRTLARPGWRAPVVRAGPMAPADRLSCPYCAHGGHVRDFLSLAAPTRPARGEVRVRPLR